MRVRCCSASACVPRSDAAAGRLGGSLKHTSPRGRAIKAPQARRGLSRELRPRVCCGARGEHTTHKPGCARAQLDHLGCTRVSRRQLGLGGARQQGARAPSPPSRACAHPKTPPPASKHSAARPETPREAKRWGHGGIEPPTSSRLTFGAGFRALCRRAHSTTQRGVLHTSLCASERSISCSIPLRKNHTTRPMPRAMLDRCRGGDTGSFWSVHAHLGETQCARQFSVLSRSKSLPPHRGVHLNTLDTSISRGTPYTARSARTLCRRRSPQLAIGARPVGQSAPARACARYWRAAPARGLKNVKSR